MKIYSPSILEELVVSGSATILGSLTVEGAISASGLTNAQTASYIEFNDVQGLTNYTSSVDGRIGSLEIESGSIRTALNNFTGSNGVVSSSAQILINSTSGTLNVNKGGTGQTSFTNGELLIGNTTGNTLTKATLSGTTDRILIANGAGSITINVDAASANTANKIVARDASGNFAAGAITSSFTQVTATASLASANYTNKVSGSGNYRLVVPVGTDLWAI
jgi:hypothetical protein